MTNIIDGIDVSSCTYAIDNSKCINAHLNYKCENNPYCYYKEFKRLQIEYNTISYMLSCEEKDNDRLQQVYQDEHCELLKYKQALMEIREIAGSIIGDANATYTEFFEKLSNILDKINEVIANCEQRASRQAVDKGNQRNGVELCDPVCDTAKPLANASNQEGAEECQK